MRVLDVLVVMVCMVFMSVMAVSQAFRAAGYERAYESARGQLEALARTKGHVSTAYVCRLK